MDAGAHAGSSAGWRLHGQIERFAGQSAGPGKPGFTGIASHSVTTGLFIRPSSLLLGFNASNAIVGSPTNWFDANAFVLPPPGEYGTVGRNSLRGPDLKMVDMSIFKNTFVGKQNLQFRIEIFNLFNRANFATPNSAALFNIDGTRIPDATQITHTATSSRQVQFGIKFVF